MLVIFDCDGVLVDSEAISCGILARRVTEFGYEITTAQVLERYQGMSWKTTRTALEKVSGRPFPDDFGPAYQAEIDETLARMVEAVPGVREVLNEIPYAICVASSGRHEKMAKTLGRTGLLERFKGRIFSSTEVEHGKPAPDLFLHAAAQMGFDPADCVVVEDSPAGVRAAIAAGMIAFGYCGATPRQRLQEAGAIPFATMVELPELLAEAAGRIAAERSRSGTRRDRLSPP